MELFRNQKAQNSSFQFIAKHPSAMLVAGGILAMLLNKNNWAIGLIIIGVLLHILWLRR
jgi:hypothetical protein